MATETLRCRRERLAADLNDPTQRRAIYAAAGPAPTLMITEGLLMYLPATTVASFAVEARRDGGISHWISDVTTSAFSKAIGGGGSRAVRQVQAGDHLEGERILETVYQSGWVTAVRRSYITDLDFAMERIGQMMAGRPQPATPPAFVADDPSGVHQFARAPVD
jgi:hypothetical protein